MTFDEFLLLLERLVEDGTLTFAEAEELALQYDEYEDLESVLAPEQIPGWTEDLDPITLAIIATTLFIVLRRITNQRNVPTAIQSLSQAQRRSMFGVVQDSFQLEVSSLGRDLANGVLTPSQWQTRFNTSLLSHFRSAAYVAYGTTNLTPEQEEAFQNAVRLQQAYATRFADQYALSVVRGNPWTPEYIVNRSMMYSGPMRAFAFQQWEITAQAGDGWVYMYIAVDDSNTCSPCIQAAAQGPYLAGQGPFPGDICLGKHRCRCSRVAVYDPEIFERLNR